MNQPLKAPSARERTAAVRAEGPHSLMESLGEVLARSASENFERKRARIVLRELAASRPPFVAEASRPLSLAEDGLR